MQVKAMAPPARERARDMGRNRMDHESHAQIPLAAAKHANPGDMS
jgi:hypothetical protein